MTLINQLFAVDILLFWYWNIGILAQLLMDCKHLHFIFLYSWTRLLVLFQILEKCDAMEAIYEHSYFNPDKPLFLMVSPTAPNPPLQVN